MTENKSGPIPIDELTEGLLKRVRNGELTVGEARDVMSDFVSRGMVVVSLDSQEKPVLESNIRKKRKPR